MALELVVEGLAGDAERLDRAGYIALLLLQRLADDLGLVTVDPFRQRAASGKRRRWGSHRRIAL